MLALVFCQNLKTEAKNTAAPPPNWTVDPAHFQFSMNVLGRLKTNGLFDNSAQNMVGVFVGNELRGVASPVLLGGAAYFFTTVYSNNYAGEVLNFRVFVQADDKIYPSTDPLIFQHNGISGKFAAPFPVKICRDTPVSFSNIAPTCNGSANGTIFSNPTGIAPPFTYFWSNGKTTKNINLLAAGTFTVTVTDAGGCISTKSTVLAQPPAISFSVNYVANAPGFDAIFTTGGGTGSFVFNRTGMPTADFKVATDPVFDHLPANTTFIFKARDANGCLKSVIKKTPSSAPSMAGSGQVLDRFANENSPAVSIKDQLTLYPNPTDNLLNISFLEEETVTGRVFVFNVFGQEIFRQKIKIEASEQVNLEIAGLPDGTYFLIFKNENGRSASERFVKFGDE